MQTVLAYETSGGAYIVARENLGTLPSLVGAAALLTDYVLTVAVSISAGIFAITSFAPVARIAQGRSLARLSRVLVLANLRGVRESGLLFALPTYLVRDLDRRSLSSSASSTFTAMPSAVTPHALPAGTGTITLFVLLRAFSSGSTALTGVEAIANGVNAFRRPHGRNAAMTLAVLGLIAISLFVGVSYLAVQTTRAAERDRVGRLADRAGGVPPGPAGFMYYAVQILTLSC